MNNRYYIYSPFEAQYQYEYRLTAILNNRQRMFDDKSTFWGRNRFELANLERALKFPDDAYHYVPSDPFTAIPYPDLRVMLLKRKYLHKLRLKFYKYKRCGKLIPHRY